MMTFAGRAYLIRLEKQTKFIISLPPQTQTFTHGTLTWHILSKQCLSTAWELGISASGLSKSVQRCFLLPLLKFMETPKLTLKVKATGEMFQRQGQDQFTTSPNGLVKL